LLLCPFDSNSSLQLHKLLPKVFLCSVCHCILVLPYCTVPAFSPPPLLISHCQKSWSRSMMCTLAWYGRRILAAVRLFCRSCTQAGMFFRVPLPPPTAVWPPHRKWSMLRLESAAVKQPPVSSLAFKTEHFIPAVKKPLRFQLLVCTSP